MPEKKTSKSRSNRGANPPGQIIREEPTPFNDTEAVSVVGPPAPRPKPKPKPREPKAARCPRCGHQEGAGFLGRQRHCKNCSEVNAFVAVF